ncbi:AzlC family ABC transporter permease [Falsirhodobacter halotolerans]|uniref:AzlC family ABC transporter permease n=1 Tax=Falsirhodobacter halotolerans TaxID=1146892 RepID=UPI001FD30C11|nr:AzlC family ABC transporter permease [Falsirhodobacter halotolerans]MCJ8140506.1 AzlC family ABC transporter permease [Falsirhodobacter halotolerans]
MTSISRAVLDGVRAALPFILVVTPFALVFGVVGAEAGLNLLEIMGFSFLVVAGASQIVAVELLRDNAPTLVILVTALAVNLRLIMYSAGMAPLLAGATLRQRAMIAYGLTDQSFALVMADAERRPRSVADRIGFFFGTVIIIVGFWYGFTLIGAMLGATIPDSFALDFAVPISFIATLAPMLRSVPHIAACAVSVAVSLALVAMPFGTGVLVAAGAAMITGAATEAWLSRRRVRA